MGTVRLLRWSKGAAAPAAWTHRPRVVPSGAATTAAAPSQCRPRPSSPSPTRAVRRVPAQSTTCLGTPGIKKMETTLLFPNMRPHQNLTIVTCSKGNLQRAVKESKSLRNARPNNFMKSQPFTAPTKTK